MKKIIYIIISIAILVIVAGILFFINNNQNNNKTDKKENVVPEKKNVFKCEKILTENSDTKKEIYEIKIDGNNNIINEKRYDQYNYKNKSDYFNKIKSLKTQNINYETNEKAQTINIIISDAPLYSMNQEIISLDKDLYITNMKNSGFDCEK